MYSQYETVEKAFNRKFGRPPGYVIVSPGRINLIGEHTDYNEGFVLPMAIDRFVTMVFNPRKDTGVNVHSLHFKDEAHFLLNDLKKEDCRWIEYIKGVAWSLLDSGLPLRGFDAVVAGDIPIGAGLSSSAALEMACAYAFAASSGLNWAPVEMAKQCQRAEIEWVGVNCGIMDQLICGSGQKGHALFIDCRTLETRPAPLPPETDIIVLDTMTRRELVTSAYGERRQQCESAAKILGVNSLRDVTAKQLSGIADRIDPVLRKRSRHVILENQRVLDAVEALTAGNAIDFGKLMTQSHHSLQKDFEVSGQALDLMVDCALKSEGCLGARMTGAGFFGCAVALVRSDSQKNFIDTVSKCFNEKTGLIPQLYPCSPHAGTQLLTINP